MPKHVISIAVPAAVGNGASVDVGPYSKLGFPCLTTFTAGTIQFQESHDGGTSWVNVGAAMTAIGIASAKFTDSATHVRCNTTAGTPVGTANASGVPFPG